MAVPNPQIPPNVAQQQQPPQQQHQQQQQQRQQSAPVPPQQHAIDLDAKKATDMIDALNLIAALRDNVNLIIDNVGKANSSNNYAHILASKAKMDASDLGGQGSGGGDGEVPDEFSADRVGYLNLEQQEFFEKTDNKFLHDRVSDMHKNIVDLDKIIKELTPVQVVNSPDFNPILLDQSDERTSVSASRLLNNYRWCNKLQECINSTSLTTYKRFQQTYAERKSPKYRTYNVRPFKKEELEKNASNILSNNEIRVVSMQRTESQFVLDIIMPQNFKFVILLFDWNIEKFQVRPLDSRILKIYANNKPSDEICHFDFEPKSLSNVFQRLEENCLFACLYFRIEHNSMHFRYFLQWLKSYVNLFNGKCVRCEKHLVNCVPPTWRDLKTFEAYHDECRIY